jgi:hypothetical protein
MITQNDYNRLYKLAKDVVASPDSEMIWNSFMTECDRIQKIINDFYVSASDDNLEYSENMLEAWDYIHSNACDFYGYSPSEWLEATMLCPQWEVLGIKLNKQLELV